MDMDKKIEIADEIYKKLVNVQRTEWNKWVEYYKNNGLERALQLAQLLSKSPMLRPQPQKNYGTIYNVMNQERKKLEKIFHENPNELLDLFGYISWKLAIPIGYGMWRREETET
jgi:hypothetical protein